MNVKNIAISCIAGGLLLLAGMFAFGAVVSLIAPYDMMSLGGMRSADDPVMALFFLYPFVLALVAAILFDMMKDTLQGTPLQKGLCFGLVLFMVETIPSMYVIFTSMTYPIGFHIESFLTGIICYPLIGIVFVKVWGIR
jgi:hypothetical protein